MEQKTLKDVFLKECVCYLGQKKQNKWGLIL